MYGWDYIEADAQSIEPSQLLIFLEVSCLVWMRQVEKHLNSRGRAGEIRFRAPTKPYAFEGNGNRNRWALVKLRLILSILLTYLQTTRQAACLMPSSTWKLVRFREHTEGNTKLTNAQVANVPPKQRYTDAGELANTIASNAYEGGIPQSALARLLKILTTRTSLDQGTVTSLVKNLYPQENVASRHVTQVVCCLGPSKSKPSPATQALLVRWLILAYELLEDRAHLGKLYAVLFNHLDMISLRKPLCHLLSLITRRKHVKPFRIQALMELIQNAGGEDRELISLLKIFKNYYPEIIIGDIGGSRRTALFFKHPDPEWSSHAKLLQDQSLEKAQASDSRGFQVVHRGTVKRSKIEVIVPALQTSRLSSKHASLEEIRDIDHFVEKFDKIELPNQIISTLGDAMAQKYIYLVQSEAANHRLDEWLKSFLQDKLEQVREDGDEEQESLSYVLSLLEAYAAFTKVSLSNWHLNVQKTNKISATSAFDSIFR